MIDDVYGLQKVGSFFIIIRISKIIVRRKVSHNNSRTQFVSLPHIKKRGIVFLIEFCISFLLGCGSKGFDDLINIA